MGRPRYRKPLVQLVNRVDKSREQRSWEQEKVPLLMRELIVLECILCYTPGIDQATMAKETKYKIPAISKSIKVLMYHEIIRLKPVRCIKLYELAPDRKKEVAALIGQFRSGKIKDVFDSHKCIYEARMYHHPHPGRLKKRLAKYLAQEGWEKSAPHPHYNEWYVYNEHGHITIRVGNRGRVTVRLEISTLAFAPPQVEIINRRKVENAAEYLEHLLGISRVKLIVSWHWRYSEIPWLFDEFAVNVVKLGRKSYFKEIEASWVPEHEEKGRDAIAAMTAIYELRSFAKRVDIRERDLAELFRRHPEWKGEVRKIQDEEATNIKEEKCKDS